MGGTPPAAPSDTTSTTTSNPWSGAAQYLTNANSSYDPSTGQYVNNGAGPTGAYQLAANYAQQYGKLTPEQQALIAHQQNVLTDQTTLNQRLAGQVNYVGDKATNGGFNTNFGPVANSKAATSNIQQDFSSLGKANPTTALSKILSGNPDNPYLARMNQANIDQATQGFQGDITKLAQQVMPGINNDAFAAGQYGGSRQGIAQGMALQGLESQAGNLATNALGSGAQLYGGAYQNAQNNMASTANNLSGLAVQNGQFNAGQTQQNNQFNANLGTTNNNQQMAQNAQNLANQTNGANLQTNAQNQYFNGQDSIYAHLQQLAQMPQAQQQNAIDAYIRSISPGASLGASSSSTQSTPYFTNPTGQALGAVSSGLGLISNMSGGGK